MVARNTMLAAFVLAELQRRDIGQEPLTYEVRETRVKEPDERETRVKEPDEPARPPRPRPLSALDVERMSAAEAKRARKAAKRLKDRLSRSEGGQG